MIRLIIFDLGKVIVDFSHLKIAEGLARYSRISKYQEPANILEEMFANGGKIISRYDEGRITSEDFFIDLRERLGLDISFPQFKQVWTEVFTEKEGIGDLIRRLKKDFTLFLLSNTNELHFGYIKENFPVIHHFDQWILSYELGLSKPNPEIFRLALKKAGVKPGESIFVDDIEGHVEGAQRIGIHAAQFKSVEQITRYVEENAYERQTR